MTLRSSSRAAVVGCASALLALTALSACYGTEIPPQHDQDPMLSGPAPTATSTGTVDPNSVTDKAGERKNSTYDKKQTQVSVSRAVRQANECAKIHTEGPFGDIQLTLVISAKGKIDDAQLPAPYDGTPIGKCVEKAFEHELIPPWDGPDEKLDATVSLKKPDGATDPNASPKKK